MKTDCAYCNKEIDRKPFYIKKHSNIFCSKKCRSTFRDKRILVSCGTCNKKIKRSLKEIAKTKSGKSFCSKSCAATWNNQQEWRTKKNHPNWVNGCSYSRELVFKNKGRTCEMCGYNKYPKILQVHHKDRDRANNELKNLEVLCPNCHCIEHFKNKDGIYWNLN